MNQILKPKMTTTFLKRTALAAVLGFTSLAALAIPSDRQQPISLVADRATFNERTGITTYTGNVIIEQGTMKLQANSIVANLNSKKQISTITANGSPARFQQPAFSRGSWRRRQIDDQAASPGVRGRRP